MGMHLHPGTILDERYRIIAVLGQGGFGITYAAENMRIGMKVAIKELYWRDHSMRSTVAPPEVVLAKPADGPLFEEQKKRFLREARTLKDFINQTSVVHVLDYFEANGTAYIVMEYIEGATLASTIAEGALPAGETVKRFLPLMEVLEEIHQAGIIHRDISPDNLIVQPDGRIRLIDFGAARQYTDESGQYTAISRSCYSPSEQYDPNGRQGPWTDVYSICATLYTCITGTPPQSAVQRVFLDELVAPSALGVQIDPKIESAIMKGLSLNSEQRYQSMGELSAALRAALPKPAPATAKPARKWPLRAAVSLLLCVCLIVGAVVWRNHAGEWKLANVRTESLRITAPSSMTAAEFAEAQEVLRGRLDDFAGKGNYIMKVSGDHIDVKMPLDCFKGMQIAAAVDEHFTELIANKSMTVQHEIQAEWDDPASGGGANQVAPAAFNVPTAILVYEFENLQMDQRREILLRNLSVRLDALDRPYAIGSLYGNQNAVTVRLPLDRLSGFIAGSLTDTNLTVSAIDAVRGILLDSTDITGVFPFTRDDGRAGIRLECNDSYDALRQYVDVMTEAGFREVYLLNSDDCAAASMRLDAPAADGAYEFAELSNDETDAESADHLYMAGYIKAVVNDTSLPLSGRLIESQYRDAKGGVDFDADWDYDAAASRVLPTGEEEELMRRIQAETDYEVTFEANGYTGEYAYTIHMNLPVDEGLAEAFAGRVSDLFATYDLLHVPARERVCIEANSEDTDHFYMRVMVTLHYSDEPGFPRYEKALWLNVGGERAESYAEALCAWWDSWDVISDGVMKLPPVV